MKREREGRISEKISFVVIVGLDVRAVSVFGKKSDAVCGLRFFGPPLRPLPFPFYVKFQQLNVNKWPK